MTSESKNQAWVHRLLGIYVGAVSLLLLINFFIDPYDYFDIGPWESSGLTNERLWKPRYFLQNSSAYNSLYFGSSIATQVHPGKINNVVSDARFYNFGLAAGNLYDYEILLSHLLDKGIVPKQIVVQIDLAAIWLFGLEPQYHRRYGPAISGENSIAFFASYLFRLHRRATINEVRHRLLGGPPEPHHSYDKATGVFSFPYREELISRNHEMYIQSEGLSVNLIHRATRPRNVIAESLESLRSIVKIAESNGTELTLIVSPYNYNLMNSILLGDYIALLRGIAGIHPFWDFSGYNSITLNSRLYYDTEHFRPVVGDLIIARVFNHPNTKLPRDFGRLVDVTNIESHISRIEREFEWADRAFGTSLDQKTTSRNSADPVQAYMESELVPEIALGNGLLELTDEGKN